MKVGFIGQGYVGKNTADDFGSRGYEVIRYSLESTYIINKESIASCDIVFIAVPTPTTPSGFDYSIVEDSLKLLRDGATAVIKSTLLPGTSQKLQSLYPKLTVLFSPEFLCESTAKEDAAHPIFTIIGLTNPSESQEKTAQEVLSILPHGGRVFVVTAQSAELFKYIHNIQGYMRVVLSNMFFDMGVKLDADWKQIEHMMNQDPMMSPFYNSPIHKSGRGAGGHCFIKDMAAFSEFFSETFPSDQLGKSVFTACEKKNLELLKSTEKDQNIVRDVYGDITQ